MPSICRLCLKTDTEYTEHFTNMNTEEYRTRMKAIIPEIDIETVISPVICSSCAELLLNAYSFKSSCIENDERIRNFANDDGKIDLESMLTKQDEILDEEVLCDVKLEIPDIDLDYNAPIEEIYVDGKLDNVETALEQPQAKKNNQKEQCKLCSKSFKYGRRWVDHVKGHFKEKFVCILCFESFEIKSSYLTHRHEIHNEGAPPIHKCDFCKKKFMHTINLQKHLKKHQREEKNLQCHLCNLKLSSTARLSEHMRVHTGERPFQCTYCGKAFAQNSTLSTHVRSIHMSERPHKCEICGKAFPVKGAHTAHMKVHQPLEKKCVCQFCGTGFRMQSCLRKHLKWHIGDREFVCQVCKKGFVNNHGLKKHMRMHNGDKPYECHLCQKRFTQSGNKKIHLKSCMRRHAEGKTDVDKMIGENAEMEAMPT